MVALISAELINLPLASDRPRRDARSVNNTRGSSPAWLNGVLQIRISFFSLLGRAEGSRVGFRVPSRPLGGSHGGPFFRSWATFFQFFSMLFRHRIFIIVLHCFFIVFFDFGSIFGGLGMVLGGFWEGFFDDLSHYHRTLRFCKK